jgi:hypothetical protein
MLEPDWGESHWPAGGFLFQDVFFCSVDWSQGCRSAAINWQRLNWNSDGSRMNCSGRGSSRRSRCVSFPVLRGIDAQLLVGTGITTATDLARADIAMLQQLMSEYAAHGKVIASCEQPSGRLRYGPRLFRRTSVEQHKRAAAWIG